MARKVLIADDNIINRQMLINILADDYDILEATNGKEAIDSIKRHYKMLSAVLLDIMMPELDGYDVLRLVNDNPLLSQIPMIVVTGSEDENSRVKALSLGANDFIIKPINPEIVRHCLRNNIALRETASILNAIQKDKLTGLYNREAFFEKAGAMIRESEAEYYTLSSFDIDNFKLINDQYGAHEGDRMLREIGEAVRHDMDHIGGVGGRISADNFAVLFPTENETASVLRKIKDGSLISLDQRPVIFSVGRCVVNDLSLSVSAIYDRAYLAKQSIKRRYDAHIADFDETMLQKLIRDQQIVSSMERALEERQFEIWLQPQYNHVQGLLTGAEALVRWRHPQKGLISPGDFIPLFEQNGFIYELDKYVWRETCRVIRGWLDSGIAPPPVSVNVSRYDIFRADLIDVILQLIHEYRIPPSLLRLEITESAFAKSTRMVVDIVKQLISLGFTIEIDDFGSGYSSLNTLKSVPAQVVKLDMRFLRDADDEHRGGSILSSIVRMSKWLSMSVIAEGVETRAQGDFLKSIGCSEVQGYLYAKPMPIPEYEQRLIAAESIAIPAQAIPISRMTSRLWDAESIDSLIFNNLVGAACVYEYSQNRIEMLRATDKYARMLGGDAMTVNDLLHLNFADYMEPSSMAEMICKINASVESMDESIGEFAFTNLPGCPGRVFIRSTLRVIAQAENRYLVYCVSENLTAQREAEQKARDYSGRLSAILNNVNCGVTAMTLDQGEPAYLIANQKYYELTGDVNPPAPGHSYWNRIWPDDLAHVSSVFKRVWDTGEPDSIEYRVKRSDGSAAWLRSFLSTARFDGVDGPVMLCTHSNITREMQSAQELLHHIPCGAGICQIKSDGAQMIYLNKRYFSYFKHSLEPARRASVFDAIHPDDRAILKAAMRPALEGHGEGTCVVRIADGPSDYIAFRVTGVAQRSESGLFIYTMFIPIAHETLSFDEMLSVALEKMMATSLDIAYVKDKDLRYICCSRAFARLAGLNSEKDAVGKTDRDLFPEPYAQKYENEDAALIRSGRSLTDVTETILSPEGGQRYARVSKYPLNNADGATIGLYGEGRDITQFRIDEARKDFLINNMPGGLAIYEGCADSLESIRPVYFSDGFCGLLGYTREEYTPLSQTNPFGLVARDAMPKLNAQIRALAQNDSPVDCVFRARHKSGADIWIHAKAVRDETKGKTITVNAVIFDVTQHQEALERLRVSEEENRLAIQMSKNVVCRYTPATKTLTVAAHVNPIYGISSILRNVPDSQIEAGFISSETADTYREFYLKILGGAPNAEAIFQHKSTKGWRWLEACASVIFSSEGAPVSAVVTYSDITENFEKDIAYKKWIQTLHNKEAGTYSLLRCHISDVSVLDAVEGSLLSIPFEPGSFRFNDYTDRYATLYVWPDDQSNFRAFLNTETLKEKFHRGERILTMEYREKHSDQEFRWLRLTVDMVEYARADDMEVYLLFENIDEAKRAALTTMERAETDPLTGILNRITFAEKVNTLIRSGKPGARHALLMLDVDGFKAVNDVFGHSAGDQALMDIAQLLKSTLRQNDLAGRLGGDEFLLFLHDIPDEQAAANRAKQICLMARKTFSAQVRISASIGIALCPRDGGSFETLYARADQTLYRVKGTGRDHFALYQDGSGGAPLDLEPYAQNTAFTSMPDEKHRMLIVDDNTIDCEMLANLFKNEFIIEKAQDGSTALLLLRHYGTAISVVLLDLMMPGMDGFAVLQEMRLSPETRDVPVIMVSADEDRETGLRAIRAGASDFVTKPVDQDILRIRVQSAVSKAENERLRATNSYLEMRAGEISRYRTILNRLGLAAAETDWEKGTFTYGPVMSERLYGRYDERTLWQIFKDDQVAQEADIQALLRLTQELAGDRSRAECATTITLKTPDGCRRAFGVTLYKLVNELGLVNRMIFTFKSEGD